MVIEYDESESDSARVFTAFDNEYHSDDDNYRSLEKLAGRYKVLDEASKKGVDHAFITMCGYSLKTLMGSRHSGSHAWKEFTNAYDTDQGDMGSWDFLIGLYQSEPEARRGINDGLIAMCGWSLPTLAKQAKLSITLPKELPLKGPLWDRFMRSPGVVEPEANLPRSSLEVHHRQTKSPRKSSKRSDEPEGIGGLR